MMKVRYLTESALYTLKESFDTFLPFFAEDTNQPLVEKLKQTLETDMIFRDTKYTFPDEPLNPSKASNDEMDSIISVFGSMKELPNAVAMDERLWAGLAIDLCWSYVRERWDIAALFDKGDDSVKNKVLDHFFYKQGPRRSFTRNAISRLWWLGKLTYDETHDDPYHRTRVVTADLGYVVDLLERNFSNNPRISAEFVDAVEAARAEVSSRDGVIMRPELRILCKYLNMLGGVYILDNLPEGMIFQKIHDKAVSIARHKGDPAPETDEDEDDEEESDVDA